MSTNRPFVISIAGFDPSAGAGVLADVKTFEQHQVYGFAINTANTIQTENDFVSIEWTALDFVLQSIETLFEAYEIKAVKIGIVPSLDYLKSIVFLIKKLSPKTKIVWDTVLRSTTEFDFLTIENQNDLIAILKEIELITPNYYEILKLDSKEKSVEVITEKLSKNCSILLKGGHHPTEIGTDYLHTPNQFFRLESKNAKIHPKHGSGCVLSAAITANLALEQELLTACKNGKNYTENFLLSNPSQLGHHYV
ncbi:hydroxymethylpyrimidine/phosphomethylpyrimidine kinase [Flavobacterium undicola]|uniref:hydroxymethylpyrimidine/phosphomethylpyrimidine kinase n=1 Tax=Flavobacterium undicola TaxID=1932779 RepID=UPI00137823D7|nr:hydroxymethylpyrimidine/phosphomethylpyrimidine kinase [Flavobacterium undicola]MBA0882541.1 hydroxymethylpyrimidine/phosphomethylpyrimidine kinase [Flavobacterium undicola]